MRYYFGVIASIWLGMIFIVAGVGKLLYEGGSFSGFLSSGPLLAVFYNLLPYAEIALGTLLILGIATRGVALIASLLVLTFAASNIFGIITGAEECATCFGVAGSLSPLSALIIDTIMAVLIVVILTCCRGRLFNKTPWFLSSGIGREDVKPSYA